MVSRRLRSSQPTSVIDGSTHCFDDVLTRVSALHASSSGERQRKKKTALYTVAGLVHALVFMRFSVWAFEMVPVSQ